MVPPAHEPLRSPSELERVYLSRRLARLEDLVAVLEQRATGATASDARVLRARADKNRARADRLRAYLRAQELAASARRTAETDLTASTVGEASRSVARPDLHPLGLDRLTS